jgi:two-component system chemotaxis sensor kinase CheA
MNDRLTPPAGTAIAAAACSGEPGIELGQFHDAFFEEAAENLAQLEQLLLQLDVGSADDELLNAIFRCAHSVKGGAATFGFADVTALAHQMETLLDKLRRHERMPSTAAVDRLLQAADALRAMLARHQGGDGDAPDPRELLAGLCALTDGRDAPAPAERLLALTAGPLPERSALHGLVELFSDIADLGSIETLADSADGLHRFKLRTRCSDSELLDLCSLHVDHALLHLAPLAAAPAAPPAAPAAGEAATLRVPVGKVDALINLVGELVTAESMLAQGCTALPPAAQLQLSAALAELQRHTRALQEAAMAIRMIPVSVVFNRFPRMLRELTAKMGKQVELLTQGEATELDKGMIEKIIDPLTHLVRNSCDHGIETPAERLAAGKPETGRLTLTASQQGSSIVIEVRDDGRGLSRSRLLAKAREHGLPLPDHLSDAEVWALIFAPGFSTAAAVTDMSGRGVGMDVVKRNISALGGGVEIHNVEGQGMGVRLRLPLTLAIMDGMTVRVADERYVLPLAAVVESFRFAPEQLRPIGACAQLVRLRDDYLPVLELQRVFELPCDGELYDDAVMVVVEAEGQRIAVRVHELLGQRQVVVKSLQPNVGAVDNVAGATLLGDGRVALILDVGALVRRARRGALQKRRAAAENRAERSPT